MSFSIIGAFVERLAGVAYSLPVPGGVWACEVPVSQEALFPSADVAYPKTDYTWTFERDYRESPRLVLRVYADQADVAEILAREMIDRLLDQPLAVPAPNVTFQVYPETPGLRVELLTQSDFAANRIFRASVDFLVEVARDDGKPGD